MQAPLASVLYMLNVAKVGIVFEMAKEKEKKFGIFFDTPRIKFHRPVKISIFSLKIYIFNLKIRICSLKICIFKLKIELMSDIRKFISEEKDTKSWLIALVVRFNPLPLRPLINKLNV